MTHEIRLEKWVTTKDGNGNNTEQIVSKVNVFAEVSGSGGDRSSINNRRTVNGETVLSNFFLFRFRFNPKFTTSGNWRVIYDGRRFTIKSIEKENQKRFWMIIKAEAN
jgi:SPP1 family predicted phage head-tail adaptor